MYDVDMWLVANPGVASRVDGIGELTYHDIVRVAVKPRLRFYPVNNRHPIDGGIWSTSTCNECCNVMTLCRKSREEAVQHQFSASSIVLDVVVSNAGYVESH